MLNSHYIDDDLFDEAMDGGQANVNGHSSPEPFNLSSLGEGLPKPGPRTCSTPEAFLGPSGASLVNLDSLIPPNPTTKNFNPFLSGQNAPLLKLVYPKNTNPVINYSHSHVDSIPRHSFIY